MSRGALSALVFGIYLMAIGVLVMLAPNLVLSLLGMALVRDVWMRVAGVLALAIGYYYLRASRDEARAFFRWTVHGRVMVPIAFTTFVLAGWAEWRLLLFATVDLAGAAWMWLALRADERGPR
jgi:hypothetical protein